MASLSDILTSAASTESASVVGADGHVKVTVGENVYDLGSIYAAPTDPKSFTSTVVKVLEALATGETEA